MSEQIDKDPVTAADGEEAAYANDEIIGHAFRRSLIVIVIIAICIGIGFWISQREEEQEAVERDTYVPPTIDAMATDIPRVQWTNITAESGITFVHRNGAVGEKLLPETMVGGAAFFDYDVDGDPDLICVSGQDWDGRDKTPSVVLYRNDGSGKFEDVTSASGFQQSFYGMGVAIGDYDADGDPDVYLTAVGPNRLYRNDEGTFVDVTAAAGVAGDDTCWSSSAGFFDGDGDGDLDLFVCNYVKWAKEIDKKLGFRLDGVGRAYGPPTNFEGSDSYYFRNDGGGKFTDDTVAAGFAVHSNDGAPLGKALAFIPFDYDRDGNLDVIVANDTVRNFVFRNLTGGKFEEVGSYTGVAYDRAGAATGSMGVDVAHLRGDDAVALVVANFANEMTSLYVASDDPSFFSDETVSEGIGPASLSRLSFGVLFFDYDLDGRPDLLQANGHLEEAINTVQPSQQYKQSAQLFWNKGPDARRCFAEVPAEQLGGLSVPIVGRGLTVADIDGDGDLDALLTQVAGTPLLLRNDQALGHEYIRVRLRNTGNNLDAIGARVELLTARGRQIQYVMPSCSYLCQREPILTFGLGSSAKIEKMTVRWPDGHLQDVGGIDRNRIIEVVRE